MATRLGGWVGRWQARWLGGWVAGWLGGQSPPHPHPTTTPTPSPSHTRTGGMFARQLHNHQHNCRGKGKKDKKWYGLKKRVRKGSTPQGEEYDDDMRELICKKHKKEQKRVPTDFIFDQMLTYRDPEDNCMAISIFQKRTKETRFNITVRRLRLREEKENGSAVLEWDGGNILVPYFAAEKEIIPHSMDGRG